MVSKISEWLAMSEIESIVVTHDNKLAVIYKKHDDHPIKKAWYEDHTVQLFFMYFAGILMGYYL